MLFAYRLAKRWLDEGRLGTLLYINMSMWIMNPTESSPYFQLKALHPHTVDVMRYYCGDIEAVQCFALKAPGRKIWSTAQFNMRFVNGVVGSLTGSYDIERGHPMERIVRDMRAFHFHPLPERIQQSFCGRVALGMEPVETR